MNALRRLPTFMVLVAALFIAGCSNSSSTPTSPTETRTGTVPAAPSTDDPLLGSWTGTMTLMAGCMSNLPRIYSWTAMIRKGGALGTEIVFSAPSLLVFSEVYPLTQSGSSITFSVPFDSTYTFSGTVAGDRRSVNGMFIGGDCSVPATAVLPTGNWSGAHQ